MESLWWVAVWATEARLSWPALCCRCSPHVTPQAGAFPRLSARDATHNTYMSALSSPLAIRPMAPASITSALQQQRKKKKVKYLPCCWIQAFWQMCLCSCALCLMKMGNFNILMPNIFISNVFSHIEKSFDVGVSLKALALLQFVIEFRNALFQLLTCYRKCDLSANVFVPNLCG